MKIESKVEVTQADELQEAVAEEVRMVEDPEDGEERIKRALGETANKS